MVQVWNLDGEETPLASRPARLAISATFTSDGQWIFAATEDKIGIFDASDAASRGVLPLAKESERSFSTLEISGDGAYLATGMDSDEILLWDILHKRVRQKIPVPVKLPSFRGRLINSIDMDPDGRWLFAVTGANFARLWRADRQPWTFEPAGEWDDVTAGAVLSGGKQLLAGNQNGELRVWDLTQKDKFDVLGEYQTSISSLKLSPDATRVGIVGRDGSVRILDLNNRGSSQLIFREIMNNAFNTKTFLAIGGDRVVCIASDGTVKVWNYRRPTASEAEVILGSPE